MKNLWIIPTDKKPIKGDLLLRHIWKGNPRLECISWWRYNETTTLGDTVVYSTLNGSFADTPSSFKTQHIYITSDEEIKEGDWYLNGVIPTNQRIIKSRGTNNTSFYKSKDVKKIILTTDQDLIADGIQAIDDEFLEWFVKNPSCEEVEVDLVPVNEFGSEITVNGYAFDKFNYKIIIPKEEPKQDFYKIGDFHKNCDDGCKYHCTKGNTQLAECLKEPKQETFTKLDTIDGQWLSPIPSEKQWQEEQLVNIFEHYPNTSPKWQYMNGLIQNSLDAKKMYSEEDMISFAWFLVENLGQYSCDRTAHFEGKYLKQFKNK